MEADANNAEAPAPEPPVNLPTLATIRAILRERILRHFQPSTRLVLGIELQPFTIWHWQALDVIGCPYTPDGEWSLSIAQLCAAVHVLSLPANSPKSLTPRGLAKWVWTFKTSMVRSLGAEAGELFAERELGELFGHLMAHYDGPARWSPQGSSRVRAPGWLYLFGQLLALGFPEKRALACTPGYARTILAAVDVAIGGSDFVGEDEVRDGLEAGHTLEDYDL